MGSSPRVPAERLQGYLEGSFAIPRLGRVEDSVARSTGRSTSVYDARVVRAIVACQTGTPAEAVAKHLRWEEFESFCADLLKGAGYGVEENILIAKPRAQVDLLARGRDHSLAVDCKRWQRPLSGASITRVAEAQSARARMLRAHIPSLEPTASVVLTLATERPMFVGGVAVVPLVALADFLENLRSFGPELDFQ